MRKFIKYWISEKVDSFRDLAFILLGLVMCILAVPMFILVGLRDIGKKTWESKNG